MPEENNDKQQGAQQDAQQQGKWYSGMEEISSDKELVKYIEDHKFDSPAKVTKSAYELQKKLGSSLKIPTDLKGLNEEQKAEILMAAKGLKNVPETPDGYVLPDLPDGKKRGDDVVTKSFKELAHKEGWDNNVVSKCCSFLDNTVAALKIQDAQNNAKKNAESIQQYEVLVQGKENAKLKAQSRDRLILKITEKLGFGYQDEKTGELRSRLSDCLDADKYGFGNMLPIVQMLDYVADALGEGQPIQGSAGAGAKKGSFFDYSKVDK